jgi:TRAP-type transport system periplasmic protein
MLAVSKKAWSSLKPEQQAKLRTEADKAFDASAAKYNAQEQEAIEFFKKEGKQVYAPDQNAFRTFAQKRYIEKYGNDWPKGALEKINAVK